MYVETITASILVGKLRKGRIKHIEGINVKAWYLFLIGCIVQIAPEYIRRLNYESISLFFDTGYIYIHSLSYILILLCLALNFDKRSITVIFIGTLLNFLVIVVNAGQMPVSFDGLKMAGCSYDLQTLKANMDIAHSVLDNTTRLSILGDIIPVPRPYPFPRMLSIGDLFIIAGVFLFFQEAMKAGIKHSRNS